MKKLLIGLLALGSVSAFAQKWELSLSAQIESVQINDEELVEISQVIFIDRAIYNLSSASDKDGVCKMFDYGTAVEVKKSKNDYYYYKRTSRIVGKDGFVKGNPISGSEIKSITCTLGNYGQNPSYPVHSRLINYISGSSSSSDSKPTSSSRTSRTTQVKIWTCYARDAFGHQYTGLNIVKSLAQQIAIQNCNSDNGKNCHDNGVDGCETN